MVKQAHRTITILFNNVLQIAEALLIVVGERDEQLKQ
jgi:hypothetical protein